METVKNWKTTVTGIILLITTLLVTFGILSQEDSDALKFNLSGLLEVVSQLIGYVSGIILIFKAKDA